MKIFAFLLFAAALIFGSPGEAAARPLCVVASFSVLADMARNVGGDAIEVASLVGPDGDAHSYQPTPEDAKTIAKADLVLVNGLGFEGWMQRLIEASGYKGTIVVASEGVAARAMFEDGQQKIIDPHAWQDLGNGRVYARNIAAALEQALPDQSPLLRARAAHYDAEIEATDHYVRAQFVGIPAARRKIITSHDAFGYFGAAYGVTFLAPAGVGGQTDPANQGRKHQRAFHRKHDQSEIDRANRQGHRSPYGRRPLRRRPVGGGRPRPYLFSDVQKQCAETESGNASEQAVERFRIKQLWRS